MSSKLELRDEEISATGGLTGERVMDGCTMLVKVASRKVTSLVISTTGR